MVGPCPNMQNYIFYCRKDMVRQKNAICDTLKGDGLNEFIPHGKANTTPHGMKKDIYLIDVGIT